LRKGRKKSSYKRGEGRSGSSAVFHDVRYREIEKTFSLACKRLLVKGITRGKEKKIVYGGGRAGLGRGRSDKLFEKKKDGVLNLNKLS